MHVVRMTFIHGMLKLWVDNQGHAMTMMGVMLPSSMAKVITTATSLQGYNCLFEQFSFMFDLF